MGKSTINFLVRKPGVLETSGICGLCPP